MKNKTIYKEFPMFITVINDCQSQNDIARQETRLSSLLGAPVAFTGVSSDFSVNATMEAAGTLIDVLDAAEDREGYVLVNVAPRGEIKKDGYNGTSFCYFQYKNVTVISTVRGHSLSLVKKLHLVDVIHLLDVDTVMKFAFEHNLVSQTVAEYVPLSQFRSYDFTPRVAFWLSQKIDLPSTTINILTVGEDIGDCIWYIDAFGNCKTSILPSQLPVKPEGQLVKTSLGELRFYKRLKDVPKRETGMYMGSSGIGTSRFLEIATQMTAGSAAKALGLVVGQELRFL